MAIATSMERVGVVMLLIELCSGIISHLVRLNQPSPNNILRCLQNCGLGMTRSNLQVVLKIIRVVETRHLIKVWTVHRRQQPKSNRRGAGLRIITEERLIHLWIKDGVAIKRRVTILNRETLPLQTATLILCLTAVAAVLQQWSRVLAWPTLFSIQILINWQQLRAFLLLLPVPLTNLMQVEVTRVVVFLVRNNRPLIEILILHQPRLVEALVTLHRETVGEGVKRKRHSLLKFRILNSACSLTYAEGIKLCRATKVVRHIIIMYTSLKIR